MEYPGLLQRTLARLPVTVNIDGRAKMNALRILDSFFDPSGEMRQVEVADTSLEVDTSRSAERLLYYMPHNVLRHFTESALYSLIRRVFQKRSGTFIDVGANLGLYSLLARQLGAGTILFEPEPEHFSFLNRNAHCMGQIAPVALSDRCGKAAFYVGDPHHSGASSLCESRGEIYDAMVEVDVTTFDAWVAQQNLSTGEIALVKVDVEGNEAATLRGMAGYFSRADAAPLWCEVRGPSSNRGADSYREAVALLDPFGYRPFVMNGETPQPFNSARDVRQVFDLLLLAPERHGYLLAA
jgi:FkbM family methyltransferase